MFRQMEKLIELLNEYNCKVLRHTDKWKEKDWKLIMEIDYNHSRSFNTDLYIVSLRYWFIKWLVENDKIDLWEKLFNLTKNDNKKSMICDLDNNDFSWEDTFLMLLAISDTPIEDLLLYLK